MKYFYRILHWLTDYECCIARSTGRNPDHVAYLSQRRDEWALLAWKEDYQIEGGLK